jgi:urease accessory protein
MEAMTEIVVALDRSGCSRLSHLRCEAPLLFRVTGAAGPELQLSWVNGTAGPVGGDHLRLRIVVHEGARVRVRTTGASIALPGPDLGHSCAQIDLELHPESSIDWWPEPSLSVAGSDHRVFMRVEAAIGARARIVESAVRGRHGESGGRLALRQRIAVGAAVVLDHEVVLADGPHATVGANGPQRAMLSAVLLGSRSPQAWVDVWPHQVGAAFSLDHGATLVTAAGADVRELAQATRELLMV